MFLLKLASLILFKRFLQRLFTFVGDFSFLEMGGQSAQKIAL